MPDHSTVTSAEVDAVLTATASSRLIKGKQKVAELGNPATPTLNMLLAKSKANVIPVRGGWKALMQSPRGGRLQGVSGRDVHRFQSKDTMFDVTYDGGSVHLGDEWVHQILKEAGIRIDHSQATRAQVIDVSKRGWWTKGAETYEVLVNLADQKLSAFTSNYKTELAKDFWRANTSDAKKWAGVDALLSVSSNTTGAVGNRDRTNQYLRHVLKASVAMADLEKTFRQARREAMRYVRDGSRLNMCVVGENVYDAVVETVFEGGSVVTTPRSTRNLDQAQGMAQAQADKLGIAFPDDAVYIAGVGLMMIEPTFKELQDEDNETISWNDRFYMFNLSHLRFCAPLHGKIIVWPCPYNQRVTRISEEGDYGLCATRLDCHVAGYISGS